MLLLGKLTLNRSCIKQAHIMEITDKDTTENNSGSVKGDKVKKAGCGISQVLKDDDGIVRHKTGVHISANEKRTILNVYTYFRRKEPEGSVRGAVREAAECTGHSRSTIYRLRKQASVGTLTLPPKPKRKKGPNKNSRLIKYGDQIVESIRATVNGLLSTNVSPSMNQILREVNGNPDLPDFKKTTLLRLLHDIGFEYVKKYKANNSKFSKRDAKDPKKDQSKIRGNSEANEEAFGSSSGWESFISDVDFELQRMHAPMIPGSQSLQHSVHHYSRMQYSPSTVLQAMQPQSSHATALTIQTHVPNSLAVHPQCSATSL